MNQNSHNQQQNKTECPVADSRSASDPKKSDPPEKNAEAKDRHPASKPWQWLKLPDAAEFRRWVDTISNFGLFVVSIVVGLFAFQQWRATENALMLTRESVEDSRHSFEISRRARLFFTGVPQFSLNKSEVFYHFDVDLTNTGESSADNVLGRTGWIILPRSMPFPDEPQFRPLANPQEGGRIAPKGSVGKQFIVGPLSKSDIRDLANEITALYIYSRIEYDDGFGHRRHVRFCARWEYHGSKWSGCAKHNDGD